MIPTIIAFLVMLNPFAMFLYLSPIMEELKSRDFFKVLFKASIISFGIFFIFMASGDFLFRAVLQINFESFRIFGGIVLFSFAYLFIVKGQKAMVHMKENLDDLAAEIALPFMVGAGTITVSILMGNKFEPTEGALAIILVLAINYIIIIFLKYVRETLSKRKMKVAFDKNMEILLRLNGFFVGAIGLNMVVTGVQALFF